MQIRLVKNEKGSVISITPTESLTPLSSPTLTDKELLIVAELIYKYLKK